MFNLETAISAWRHSLRYNRTFLPEDLDELERHVRDQVAAAVTRGEDEETAFRRAIREMGHLGAIDNEYRKIYWEKRRHSGKAASEILWRITMLKNYVMIAGRNVMRHKGYSAINVLGLSIGLAAFILIALFVRHELSYDRFHSKSDRLYRINQYDDLYTSGAHAPALMADVPEVERAIRISRRWPEVLVRQGDVSYYEQDFFFTDSTFFDLFDFPLLSGDTATALRNPFSVVITEEMASKYFPEEDPLGKKLSIKGLWDPGDFEITGVAANVPGNSHFQFNFLASYSTRYLYENVDNLESWYHYGDLTYVLLRPGTDVEALEAKMPDFFVTHSGRFQDGDVPDLTGVIRFQPVTDIHLYSHLEHELEVNAEPKYLYIFSAIALLVLLIACINYVNLTTARSATRAREVGIRKVSGAYRRQLVCQFVSESALLVLLSLLLALLLARLSTSIFGSLLNRQLDFTVVGSALWLVVAGVVLIVGLLCGLYPALYLSGFHPVHVLKGLVTRGSSNSKFRSGTVVIQFTASVVLIAGTITIQKQLSYMRNERLGMNPEQVLVLATRNALGSEQYQAFSSELTKLSKVRSISGSYTVPPMEIEDFSQLMPRRPAQGEAPEIINAISTSPGYLETLEIELAEGRDFIPDDVERGRNYMAVLLNEAAVRKFGWTDPIGRELCCWEPVARVVGVVKDFHYQSLKEEIAPLGIIATRGSAYVFVRTGTEDLPATIDSIRETYARFAPGIPLEMTFLDDEFAAAYDAEERLAESFSLFSGLAILIACLGLFGLASFMAQRRTREIGIRKVLGATVAGIVVLLSRDFVRLVLAAFVVGMPAAYLLMTGWLADFAYRTTIGPGIFLMSGALILLIALLSVGHQALRAGFTNPAESIRHE